MMRRGAGSQAGLVACGGKLVLKEVAAGECW